MGTLIREATIPEIQALIGHDLGASDWLLVEQDSVNAFGRATGDLNEIHVDPEVGRAWGFPGTIAHGFFTLSLIMKLQEGLVPTPATMTHGFNYGLESVRFTNPVHVGKRVRGLFRLIDFRQKDPGAWRYQIDTVIEIDGIIKPALTCQWLSIVYCE